MDNNTMITTYNTAVTDAASEILGKERRRKKPWVTRDVLDLCDERRKFKKKRYEAEGAKIQGSKQEDSKGSEKSKGGLDRCSVQGNSNLPEQNQKQKSISAGAGPNLRETGKILNYPGQVWDMSY